MPLYRLRPERARECLDATFGLKHVHTNADGYLGVVWKAAQPGVAASKEIPDPLPEFFPRFLGVAEGPSDYPYVRLFSRLARSTNHPRWRKSHLAGSFGNSARSTFKEILTITGKGNDIRYLLEKGHAAEALEHLLHGKPIPVYPLALFLYRDLAFDLDTATTSAWVEHFQEDFGYMDKSGEPTADYWALFSEDDAEAYALADDWLTIHDPEASASANSTPDDDTEA